MRRDWAGTLLGLAVFAVGGFLLYTVFNEAMTLYREPPQRTLGIERGKAVDLNLAGGNLAGVLMKVLLLALMAFVGGLVCRAGAQLYGKSVLPKPHRDDPHE